MSVLLGALLAVPLYAPGGEASFPGANGELAVYNRVGDTQEHEIQLVDLDTGRVETFLSNGAWNGHPAWAPDGRRLAFVSDLEEENKPSSWFQDLYTIEDDGTGLRKLVDNEELPDRQNTDVPSRGARCPTWSPDGDRIAFVALVDVHNEWLFTVDTDGSGLTLLREDFGCPLEWSPDGGAILGNDTSQSFRKSLALHDLEEGETVDLGEGRNPRWAPDGSRFVFQHRVTKRIDGQNRAAWELFVADRDGSDRRRITFTPNWRDGEFPVPGNSTNPEWSPNGEEILFRSLRNGHAGTYAIRPDGTGERRLPVDPTDVSHVRSWRPLRDGLEVRVLDGGPADGHALPVGGATVRLFRDGEEEPTEPRTRGLGSYHFPDVAPGDYRVRVTLEDASPQGPVFDTRYTEDAEDPVWIEVEATVPDADELVTVDAAFTDDPDVVDTNVDDRRRLDDVAAVFRNVHRFAEWTKRRLTPDLVELPVAFYLFASADPVTGGTVRPDDAYYRGGIVVMGSDASDHADRDGRGSDQAPENAEWHEFVHHLYETNVHDGSAPCDPSAQNHGGYPNPDTCDSMHEGFAIFLPTVASQELDGDPDDEYASTGIFLEESRKAWGSSGPHERESFAVATLLWDLHDDVEDTETTAFRRDGEHVELPDLYRDRIALGLGGLWGVLTSAQPPTAAALRAAFDAPPTRDLDGDGTDDIAPADEVFLMHGFFPVLVTEQDVAGDHRTYHYDLDTAERIGLPGDPLNEAVGRTDHEESDDPGTELVPRFGTPVHDGADLLVGVRDADGRPVTGAEVRLSLDTPAGTFATQRVLASPDDAVHIEPRPHYDHRLEGGAMPDCDAAGGAHVGIHVEAVVNGFRSGDAASLDNCTFWRAVAAGEPPQLDFTFPRDAAAPRSEADRHTAGDPSGTWSSEPWTVTLRCEDAPADEGFASGCLRTEYRVDDGPWLQYVRPVEVTSEGTHTLEYRSVDRAGNTEGVRTLSLGIDRTAPETTAIVPPVAASQAPVPLLALANDDLSGTDEVCFRITPVEGSEPSGCAEASGPGNVLGAGPWTATVELSPGVYEVVVVAKDRAGNEGGTEPSRITVL